MKIALVGPVPPPYGGVSVSVERFSKNQEKRVDINVLDTADFQQGKFSKRIIFCLKLINFFFKYKRYNIIHIHSYSLSHILTYVFLSKFFNSKHLI